MALLLQNKKVILRGLEPEDLEFLYQAENNTDIWKVSNTYSPYTRFILKQYIGNSHEDIFTNKQLRLIISSVNDAEKPIGAIDLFDFDPFHMRAGIGILIHRIEDQNHGYASAALTLLIDYCFTYLLLHQLYCNIGADNPASVHLFEKIGFNRSGVKKEWLRTESGWIDEYFYQLMNDVKS